MNMLLKVFFLFPFLLQAAEHNGPLNKEGEYLGSIPSEIPSWFKESFLDFAEDVAEAAEANKRVMIYFHQSGCPYCAKLVDENFTDPQIKKYTQDNFESISINMWGDKEVVSIGDKTFTEKEFALALKVHYTPTILFLNEQGKTVLRLNGYYPPEKFRNALRFIGGHKEKELSFYQFNQSQSQLKTAGTHVIQGEDFFIKTSDLNALRQTTGNVTAVFFEKNNCFDCSVLHDKVLTDSTTRDIVKRFNNIQLDVESKQLIVTPTGESITIADWVKKLNISYFPSVVFFDSKGQDVMRISGFIKSFHFQSVYDYVYEKAYLTEPSFQRYIAARGERIRAAGFNTDIWGYHSEYTLQEISIK